MIFEYSVQKTFTQSVQVDDVGNTSLRCIAKGYIEYYIVTQTLFGKTSILKFGPVLQDIEELQDGFSLTHRKMDYKEPSIQKEINQFINDPRKEIEEIEVIDEEQAVNAIPKIATFFAEM